MKSLKNYSVRGNEWNLPDHVTDQDYSIVLCKARTGNSGIGNRAPLQGLKTALKICPFCYNENVVEYRLNEGHILFNCSKLRGLQTKHGFSNYLTNYKGDKERALWAYLGGDKCTTRELLGRGKLLQGFLGDYFERIYQTPTVQQMLN